MPLKPIHHNPDPLYRLLREGRVQDFNERRQRGDVPNLQDCDFRGLDLRGLVADGIDFSGSYFRQTDLRGIDFSHANLAGASINGAKISGTFFPRELPAEEVVLSLLHGTRMRYR